ncbi:hypothetical protein C8J31_102694 [Rhizobium sp. PP-CC-2G-626]|nr:hypothetical protein C8J31_102694 [Rhizobium sp. PP-CC-2G-626]
MSKTVVFGFPGDSQFYVADVEAGTVKPLEDTDGRAGELRSSSAPFIRGVDFAVALDPADKAFSGLFD